MRRLGKGRFRLFQGQRGISLIETLVALAILGAIGVIFLNGLTTTSKGVMISQEKVSAESLAKSQVEYIKAQDYIPIDDYGSENCTYEKIAIPDDLVGRGYDIEINLLPAPIFSGGERGFELQSITVVIKRNGEAMLRMSSYRCGSSG